MLRAVAFSPSTSSSQVIGHRSYERYAFPCLSVAAQLFSRTCTYSDCAAAEGGGRPSGAHTGARFKRRSADPTVQAGRPLEP